MFIAAQIGVLVIILDQRLELFSRRGKIRTGGLKDDPAKEPIAASYSAPGVLAEAGISTTAANRYEQLAGPREKQAYQAADATAELYASGI